MWKFLTISIAILSIVTLGFLFFRTNTKLKEAGIETGIELSPFSKIVEETPVNSVQEEINPLGEVIHILLLGIDRRSREEAYRSDIMILLSINPDTNQVILTSLPRDLWWNGGRLNAVFLNEGWENLQEAMSVITGMKPERYILTDFKDFSWIVDAMGGVPVSVERTFTDTGYPVDETFEYQTISFTSGPELLTGARALIYARSRKGDNGEGSDWMRMKRQHKILTGMLNAVLTPKSIFNPMVVENAFKTVTNGKMDTNLTITEAKYLWDFYKDKDKYTFLSLFLDNEYVYSPPMEEYGGAWVLTEREGGYAKFRKKLSEMLNGTYTEDLVDDATSISVEN